MKGFTLIELSIVLVIIGLIVGGVLVGQNLIAAAAIRAQITQIEKFNTATNTFRGKYGGLPGDLQLNLANQFGFFTSGCNGTQGFRDGNGLIDGFSSPWVYAQAEEETGLFWLDLSTVNLIEGTLGTAVNCSGSSPVLSTAGGANYIGNFMPAAKIGAGNFVYVYEYNASNWFGLSAVTSTNNGGQVNSGTTLTPMQAYNMDKKVDDGFPTTGSVQAMFLNGPTSGSPPQSANAQASDSATSCYNTSNAYSIAYNNGNAASCALSFRFQ